MSPSNPLQVTPSTTKYKYATSEPLALEFGIPLERFAALHPEYHHFVVGALIFSPQIGRKRRIITPADKEEEPSKESKWKNENITDSNPAVLILQRASSDSYPNTWDFPGGSVDFPSLVPAGTSTSAAPPTTSTATIIGTDAATVDVLEVDGDASILDAVAREVFEETGYHVKHIHALVNVNTWTVEKLRTSVGVVGSDGTLTGGGLKVVVKYSFLVDVYDDDDGGGGGDDDDDDDDDDHTKKRILTHWEDRVKLAPGEHQNYLWVTEAEIERSEKWRATRNISGLWSVMVPGAAGSNLDSKEVEEGPVYDFIGELGSTTLKSFATYRKVAQEKY